LLDDASEEGLKAALSSLPISSECRGILVTSQLIKTKQEFSNFFAGEDHLLVDALKCDVLDESNAMKLFHSCGFAFDCEDVDASHDPSSEAKKNISTELKVLFSCYNLFLLS
jgi:hypothetical protein